MIITNAAIARRITVYVFLVLIVLSGAYSYVALPREASPEIVIPFVIVTTTYEGVAPADIESLITVPIERKLTGLSDLKKLESRSVEGVSIITIEFMPSIDIDDALQKVRDKVNQAENDLPQEADTPFVTEINFSELPVMIMSLSGDIGVAALTRIAEELEDRIEAVRGVLDVEIIGGVEREIQIEVDPQRVAEYGISLAELVSLTGMENVNTPGGALDLGEAKYFVRTPGEFQSPEEIMNLVVKRGEFGTVYLRDIGEVRDGFKERETYSRVNGIASVTLTVSKRAGENVIHMSDAVRRLLDEARDELPAGVNVIITTDFSDDIRDMVAELENSILSGLVLVLAVILLFLGLKNALFVALAIPISMLITFACLNIMGVTLNMVVLFSLILALGMLVDNGIVVVENIHRHMQQGKAPVAAAITGAAEVAWPITTSTLTTLAAFSPLFFWPGIVGEFMYFLPLTLTLALCGSLFVGLVVNPALCAGLLRPGTAKPLQDGRRRAWIIQLYELTLRTALRWRAVTVTIAVMTLVVIAGLYFREFRLEFFPTTEPRRAYVELELPDGTNLDTSNAYVRTIEDRVEAYRDDIRYVIANVGSRGADPFAMGQANTPHLSRVTLQFEPLDEVTTLPSQIIREVRQLFSDVSGAEIRIDREEMGPPTGAPVNIEISGPDFRVLGQLAEQVKEQVRDVPGLVDLRDDFDAGKPEVNVVVDREQSLVTGLGTQFIGNAVKAAIQGRKAADYREGDEEYDVIVRFPKEFREDLRNLETMNLINIDGRPIPFSAVARIEEGNGMGSIRRINRTRTVTVSADAAEDYIGAEVLRQAREELQGFPLPEGYRISYTGESEDMEEAQGFLGRAFIVAILLIAIVLVTQFNSVVQPLIILSSVILSLAGVFLGLNLFNMPFGVVMTGIGCISLAGVVVNNAIVLLDFINQLKARGLSVHDAIIEAGITRFRPVMLTAVTTILGLIPMAAGISFNFRELRWTLNSESSQWWGPMAIAVIFGLAFATLLTLVVAPTLYSLLDGFVGALRRLFLGERADIAGAQPEPMAK